MGRWRIIGLMLMGALVVSFVGCGRNQQGVEEILFALSGACAELPDGECYVFGSEQGTALSDGEREDLYGADSDGIFAAVEEYAIYVSSFPVPCELAVFRCYGRNDAHRVAAMCMERVEMLRVALRGSEWESWVGEARILCRGRMVVMIVGEDAEALERQALSLLR